MVYNGKSIVSVIGNRKLQQINFSSINRELWKMHIWYTLGELLCTISSKLLQQCDILRA